MRWRILALLFLARVGLGLQFQTLASVADDLVVGFGLDYAGIGLLIGLFMAPGLFLAIPAGYWARYVSDRYMVVLGLGALAFGGLVSAGATESWTIGAGRVFAGIGFLFSTLYLTKMVADWFQGREIATAMSLLVMSWPFGIAMGQVGYAWVSNAFGWHVPFQIASIYCALAAVGVMIFYKDPDDLAPVKNLGAVKNDGASARLSGQEWRLIVIAGSAWGSINAGYVIFLSFGPKVLQALGETAFAAAGTISVASWVLIASGAVCGQIADRSGRRMTILLVCMCMAVAGLLLLSLPGAGFGASLLFGLIGMAPAGIIMALAGEAVRPQARAFGMGIFFTVYYAFNWVIPPIAGAILDATGSTHGPIWLAILLFAAVVPLAAAYQSEKGRTVHA